MLENEWVYMIHFRPMVEIGWVYMILTLISRPMLINVWVYMMIISRPMLENGWVYMIMTHF